MKVNKQVTGVGSHHMGSEVIKLGCKGPCPLRNLTGPTYFSDSFSPVYGPPIYASFQVSKPFLLKPEHLNYRFLFNNHLRSKEERFLSSGPNPQGSDAMTQLCIWKHTLQRPG